MRREVKQHQNVGIWSRERFIAEPYTEMSGLFLDFWQKPFIGKVREGVLLVVSDFLVSDPLL